MLSKIIKYSDLTIKKSLSPSNYEDIIIRNENTKTLAELVKNFQKGKEVGSDSYVHKSKKFFLRTKALQPGTYLLDMNQESAVPIIPQSFINHGLRKGLILISKDSNIGEVAYLEKDYLDYMMSAGLFSLNILENKFYILAMMKNDNFKAQLNAMVPPGTIIKHAKKLFLDCKIPFPNRSVQETIKFVEEITRAIIRRETEICVLYKKIDVILNEELLAKCKIDKFNNYVPKYSDILKEMRIDTGLYEREYKSIINCLQTYNQGSFFKIPVELIKSGSTPKNRIMNKGSKKWITPSIFGELGYFTSDERIICKENNITKDCIILKNRTLKGQLGRFVGTAAFYDFSKLGLGHHNQGCYRIEDLPSDELKYIAVLLNTPIYRKLCGYMSLGSKMREIKLNQFALIPFPNFDISIKKILVNLYDNDIELPNKREIYIDELENFDIENMDRFGIIQLARQKQHFEHQLNSIIKNIIDDDRASFDLNLISLP